MAQKDHPDEGPTLELPSLFRRKKKAPQIEAEDSLAVDTDLAEPPDEIAPIQTTDVLDEPVAEPVEEAPAPTLDSVGSPDDLVAEPETSPTLDEPPAEAAPEPVAADSVEPEPLEAEPVDAAPVDAVPVEEHLVTAAPLDAAPVDEQHVEAPRVEDEAVPEPLRAPAAAKPPMRDRIQAGLPDLAADTAAIVVGAVVGLLGCAATFLSLKGCELATGTDSCGGPGLLVLIVILVAMILLGALLLRMFRVPEPGNLSFLGVAITAVVILVFLIKYLFSPWMFVVVPVLSALAYGVARWVTTRWTDDGDDRKTDWSHDVR